MCLHFTVVVSKTFWHSLNQTVPISDDAQPENIYFVQCERDISFVVAFTKRPEGERQNCTNIVKSIDVIRS